MRKSVEAAWATWMTVLVAGVVGCGSVDVAPGTTDSAPAIGAGGSATSTSTSSSSGIGGAACVPVEDGNCVGCKAPSDREGTDDECQTRTCVSGLCGVAFTAANTPVAAQTAGDCKTAACDGSGAVTAIADDAALPADDGDPCSVETCKAGQPGRPPAKNGAACSVTTNELPSAPDNDVSVLLNTCSP